MLTVGIEDQLPQAPAVQKRWPLLGMGGGVVGPRMPLGLEFAALGQAEVAVFTDPQQATGGCVENRRREPGHALMVSAFNQATVPPVEAGRVDDANVAALELRQIRLAFQRARAGQRAAVVAQGLVTQCEWVDTD